MIGVKRSLLPCVALVAVVFLCGAGSYVPGVPPLEPPLGERLPLVSVIPFVMLLVAIALLPVFGGSWWEANANKGKVAALFALPLAGLMVFHFGWTGLEAIVERLFEYISLIVLLGSLFIVCGGILVESSPKGSPAVNTGLLALGAVLSNLIGTTGASMILIRPLIRANQHRQRVAHVPIFLIFIVANCGGLLTPLGDPPLFLGYLAGVPFAWTLKLFPVWASSTAPCWRSSTSGIGEPSFGTSPFRRRRSLKSLFPNRTIPKRVGSACLAFTTSCCSRASC